MSVLLRNHVLASNPLTLRTYLPTLSRENGIVVKLGLFVSCLYILSWILPNFLFVFVRPFLLSTSALFGAIAYVKLRKLPRLCLPATIALLIQLWSLLTAIYASLSLGRSLGIGRVDLYMMEHMIPFVVAWYLIKLNPTTKTFLLYSTLIALSISCAVAWLQFFKFGPAISLSAFYTYKAIDFWDGTAGLRAVGLTFHPNSLAFQGVVCLGFAASRLIRYPSDRKSWIMFFFFSGAIVFSQARLGYIVLIVVGAVVLFYLYRENRSVFLKLILVCLALLSFAFFIGQKRLGYAIQSTSISNDSSYQFRSENVWSQLNPILEQRSLTGIGPSSGLLLGTGSEDKWVPVGRVMESGYRVFIAMYGIPGLLLLCFFLLSGLYFPLSKLRGRLCAVDYGASIASACSFAFIAFNCYTANTFDGYMQLPLAFFLLGFVNTISDKPMINRNMAIQSKQLKSDI